MFDKVRRYIKDNNMLNNGDKVVIGLSGGADSVCLFHILHRLKSEYLLELYAVHINHGIRGKEAYEDAEFCKKYAEEYGVSFRCADYDVPSLAVRWNVTEEEAGRKIRYEEFDKELKYNAATKIAVAHHENDQAETILFRMCRGTGIKGMAGIPAVRDNIIRPLLMVSKDDILEYIELNGLSYREDATNSCVDYDRNRIRNVVIPELEKINPRTVLHIGLLADQMSELYDWFETCVREYYESNVITDSQGLSVSESVLQDMQPVAARELIRCMIAELTSSLKDIEKRHIDMVYGLIGAGSGTAVNLPYNIVAQNEYGNIRMTVIMPGEYGNTILEDRCVEITGDTLSIEYKGVYLPDENRYCPEITLNCSIRHSSDDIDNIPKNNCTKWFGYDKITSKIIVRRPMTGDYIVIDGGRHKKLTRYIIDAKIPRRYRDNLLVVASESHVLWVVGGRGSMGCYVDEDTASLLCISIDY